MKNKTLVKLSIVAPVYCEELVIQEFFERTSQVLSSLPNHYRHEIIFVNDGSTDESLRKLVSLAKDQKNIKIIDLSRNFGHQIAITAGIDYAEGDAVVLIDSDLQDPPEVIPAMLEKWESGYHVVYGVRSKREGERFLKKISAKIYYRFLDRISNMELPKDTGDFRLIDRKVVDALKNIPEQNRYLRGLVPWIGFRQCGVEYERDKRHAGETKYTLHKMMRLAFDGVTGFSDEPLYLSLRAGILVSLSSFLLILFYVIKKICLPASTIQGWTSTIILILFIGGIQLTSFGIIGLYIGRIYREVKRRPLYLVSEVYGFEDSKGDG